MKTSPWGPRDVLPTTAAELVTDIDKQFPVVNPVPGTPMDEVWFNAGVRYLINDLLQRKFRGESPIPPELLEADDDT